MTRKKYDKDIYDDYSSDSSTSSDTSVESVDINDVYDVISYHWDFFDSDLKDWNDEVDIYNYVFTNKERPCGYKHLMTEDDGVVLFVRKLLYALRVPVTKNKIKQVVYDLLNKRNKLILS